MFLRHCLTDNDRRVTHSIKVSGAASASAVSDVTQHRATNWSRNCQAFFSGVALPLHGAFSSTVNTVNTRGRHFAKTASTNNFVMTLVATSCLALVSQTPDSIGSAEILTIKKQPKDQKQNPPEIVEAHKCCNDQSQGSPPEHNEQKMSSPTVSVDGEGS